MQGLPDYWIIECDDGSATPLRVATSAVTSPLAFGPDPNAAIDTSRREKMPLGAEMAWMVDFNAAVGCGMAVAIPLTAQQRSSGFKRIVAYGLRTSDDGATTLSTLLNDHRFTDGLAFIPQGTPTKNTVDASSGVTTSDPGDNASYDLMFPSSGLPLTADVTVSRRAGGAARAGDAATAGRKLHRLERRPARRLPARPGPGHDLRPGRRCGRPRPAGRDRHGDRAVARHHRLLHPRHGGGQHSVCAACDLRAVAARSLRAIRSRLRLHPGDLRRRNAYGVAVASDWQRYVPAGPGDETGLTGFLAKAYALWLQSQPSVPNVMATGTAADAAFAATMPMDAASITYGVQNVIGPSVFESLLAWQGGASVVAAWQQARAAEVAATCTAYGIAETNPMVGFTTPFLSPVPVTAPVVQSQPLSSTAALAAPGNYLASASPRRASATSKTRIFRAARRRPRSSIRCCGNPSFAPMSTSPPMRSSRPA